jgi:hypothetical protein
VTVALVALMLACIATGLAYTISHPDQAPGTTSSPSAIQIESTPPGAAVFVAGEPTGLKTPTAVTGDSNGQLVIRLELANYAPVTRTIDVQAGATMQVTLTPSQGRLILSDLPPGAIIAIDGDEYAAGDVIAAAAGKHMIRIAVDGRSVIEQAIDTTAGDQVLKLVAGKLVRN